MNKNKNNKSFKKSSTSCDSHTSLLSTWLDKISLTDIEEISYSGNTSVGFKDLRNRLYKIEANPLPAISIVIICKNEERCISRCLNSITAQVSEVDEILVVDTGSTDRTKSIIYTNYPEVKLLHFEWTNDFAQARNYGIEIASQSWVFFIDADEVLCEDSLSSLKSHIQIVEALGLSDVTFSPMIINSDGSVLRSVRRILNKKENIRYWGIVHEELRKLGMNPTQLPRHISFKDVCLEHDGYEKDVVSSKNKAFIYFNLLKKIRKLEPNNPRWEYFYCRDGKEFLSNNTYVRGLKKVIRLSSDESSHYRVRALSELGMYYIGKNMLNEASKQINALAKSLPESSDVFYLRCLIQITKTKKIFKLILDELLKYKSDHTEIEFSSFNSQGFHIDFLISMTLYEIGCYSEAFDIMRKLEEKKYLQFNDVFGNLMGALSNKQAFCEKR